MDRELSITWKLGFRIWWEYFCRCLVLSIASLAIILPVEVFLVLLHAPSQIVWWVNLPLRIITGCGISFVALVWTLRKTYGEVRIAFVSKESSIEPPKDEKEKTTGFDY
jgi:hypothetical protein